VVAAATPAHAELIELAAEAGIPCFCEKPIALDLEATDRVLRRVGAAGTLLQIGFQRRFDAGYRAAREAVAAGALGRLRLVRAASYDPAPPPEEYVASSGGLWRDMLVHDFDVLPWVVGEEVVEVYAEGATHDELFARHADVDAAGVLLHFAGGLLGVVTCSRVDPLGYDIRLELLGTRDSVAVGWDARTPLRSLEPGMDPPPGPAYRDFMDRFQPAYRAELEAFLQAAVEGAPSPVPGEEARKSLVVALACERSRREHRPVAVSEVA
jgi:myo-inositol 2-dehydrogenase/D-chiro-inositol 1-dehydrogenase